MLRTATIVLALLLAVGSVHAQTAATVDLSAYTAGRIDLAEAMRLEHAKEQHAKIVRNVGIALTLLGTVSTIVGSIYLPSGSFCDSCSDDEIRRDDRLSSIGAGLLVAGQVAAVAGITMWAAGQTHASRAEKAQLSMSASGVRLTF